MAFLRPFFRLSFSQLATLPRVFLCVLACRIGLSLKPLKTLEWSRRIQLGSPSNVPVRRLVWAVTAASRRIPRSTCLVQAVALHYLLTRAGHASSIHIGVKKPDGRNFEAHAWVELDHEILIGGSPSASFTPILAVQNR